MKLRLKDLKIFGNEIIRHSFPLKLFYANKMLHIKYNIGVTIFYVSTFQ